MSGPQTPGNTHEGHLGTQLRAGREAAGWSRTVIADMTGMSVAVVARIELRGRGTEEELNGYRDALKVALGEVVTGDGLTTTVQPAVTKSPAVTGFLEERGAVRVTEWEGLRRGDRVKVRGEKGAFMFLYFHRDDHQEYVELSGPISQVRGQIRGRQLRSVRPDRIIRSGRK